MIEDTNKKDKDINPLKEQKWTNLKNLPKNAPDGQVGFGVAQQPIGDIAAHLQIQSMGQEIIDMLLKKNIQYGNSVLSPKRIFSKADTSEQIKVRIDDKLNRLISGDDSIESDEDVIFDLIGYLILLLVHNEHYTQHMQEDEET